MVPIYWNSSFSKKAHTDVEKLKRRAPKEEPKTAFFSSSSLKAAKKIFPFQDRHQPF
jgi:hypothetical protein